MRKLISLLLLFSYVNTALAVGVDVHFCGGHVTDIKLLGFGQAHCDCPEGSMPKGCCRNEFHLCKKDNHKGQAVAVVMDPESFIQVSFILPDYISPLPGMNLGIENSQTKNYNGIKFRPSWPLFILNENYRI